MQLYAAHLPTHAAKDDAHHAAHALLQRAFARQYPTTSFPAMAQDVHGKPYFPEQPAIHFNLSHCDGLVVCGLSSQPLGVDAERIRPLRPRVLRRAFSPAEVQAIMQSPQPDALFFQLWTRKESYVKALGIGIAYPLRTVAFYTETNGGFTACTLPDWQIGTQLVQNVWAVSYCIAPSDTPPDDIYWI